ncbi:MAG: hypothetical protein KDA91_19755 [Planctomycetaceae bacterium]|nr:hypothetical protein [Planctomycetaceae bacterium]
MSKRFLRAWEIDRDYSIKGDFLRALKERYGLTTYGLGEPLYEVSELEDAIFQHGKDGAPAIAELKTIVRQTRRANKTLRTDPPQ